MGSLLEHFGITFGTFWDHFGNILGSLWEHFGITLGGLITTAVCWRLVFQTFPVCVFVLLRGVEKEAQTQSGLGTKEHTQGFTAGVVFKEKEDFEIVPPPRLKSSIFVGVAGAHISQNAFQMSD